MNDRFLDIKLVIFDWGNTLMRDDPQQQEPMYMWDKVELIPEAIETLEYLSKKYLMCVATNAGVSDTQAMIKALERVNIARYFQYFFSSIDLGVNKPLPAFFEKICHEIGILPSQTVMIGNSYEKDIIGAKQAGLYTIFFDEWGKTNLNPDADRVIHHLNELMRLL
ncbi:MAG TPA: HAD-IA family hydrolase [Bacteroidales bacterium]|nr:HAD-IA family hydrolase [Bacteroidales bacterium]